MSDIRTTYQIESAIKLAQLGYLFRTFKHATLGMQDFSGTGSRSGTTLGFGDTRLLWGIIYGRGHMLLQPNAVTSSFKMNFSTEQLTLIQDDAQSTFQNDIDALYTVFEWSATSIEEQHSAPPSIDQYCRSINQISHWKKLSALSCLRNIHEEQFSRLEAINECSFLNELLSLDQLSFMNQNLIPWKAWATPLPPSLGNCATDNAHAECLALILLEEWLPRDIPVLIIMDSEAERGRYHSLRMKENTTNRFLIRSIMSGVSKCLGSRLAHAISYHQQTCDTISNNTTFHITEFYLHAKEWCFMNTGEESLWKTTQWDNGQSRTIWAIRSHQLEESFVISSKNRYRSNIVPNRTFVSANQWADNICNAILRFQRNAFHSKCPQNLRKWFLPKVSIGITGPIFILTFNGVSLDRSVSTAIEDICDLEFIRRIALRPTQGLIIRLRKSLFVKPEMIGRQGYLRRSLEGKTKTHTRAMYTDVEYRKAIIYKYAIDELWENDSERFACTLKKATKCYVYLRCPCCIDTVGTYSSSDLEQKAPTVFPFPQDANSNSGFYGNLRHYRFYCLNDNIQAIRDKMNQLLEDHLGALLKIASNWGRLGFSTLLNRAIHALIILDRLPFHNAFTNNHNYVKLEKSSFACLTSEDWLSLLDSLSERNCLFAQTNFRRWPLLHQLGFIPANCYTHFEMEDGEYSPCDLISMGIIPIASQDIILQFAT